MKPVMTYCKAKSPPCRELRPLLNVDPVLHAVTRRIMAKRYLLGLWLFVSFFLGSAIGTAAQDDRAQIRVNVNLVQLNVAVTDRDGNYITGLRPQDFAISEDKIPEKIATFEEGSAPARTFTENGQS